jgi:RNA polymerase sigma-70 factor (ECF subfamily)
MSEGDTTAAVQRYLDQMAGDSPVEPIIQALLDRVLRRLHLWCATILYRSYPRLAQAPISLQADELLGAVEERLRKALRENPPQNVRQFFALANQQMRWELNHLTRLLDDQSAAVEPCEGNAPSPGSSASGRTLASQRVLQAVGELPDDEREALGLVRLQGMTDTETARILGVSAATVNRRLTRGLLLLATQLADHRPREEARDSI